jgi:hypothetical protein
LKKGLELSGEEKKYHETLSGLQSAFVNTDVYKLKDCLLEEILDETDYALFDKYFP